MKRLILIHMYIGKGRLRPRVERGVLGKGVSGFEGAPQTPTFGASDCLVWP